METNTLILIIAILLFVLACIFIPIHLYHNKQLEMIKNGYVQKVVIIRDGTFPLYEIIWTKESNNVKE